jgi:hypothetical protein
MPEEAQLQPIAPKQKKQITKLIIIVSVLVGLISIPYPFSSIIIRLVQELTILSGIFYSSPYITLVVTRAFFWTYFLVTLILNAWLLKIALRQKDPSAICVSIVFFCILLVPYIFVLVFGILIGMH